MNRIMLRFMCLILIFIGTGICSFSQEEEDDPTLWLSGNYSIDPGVESSNVYLGFYGWDQRVNLGYYPNAEEKLTEVHPSLTYIDQLYLAEGSFQADIPLGQYVYSSLNFNISTMSAKHSKGLDVDSFWWAGGTLVLPLSEHFALIGGCGVSSEGGDKELLPSGGLYYTPPWDWKLEIALIFPMQSGFRLESPNSFLVIMADFMNPQALVEINPWERWTFFAQYRRLSESIALDSDRVTMPGDRLQLDRDDLSGGVRVELWKETITMEIRYIQSIANQYRFKDGSKDRGSEKNLPMESAIGLSFAYSF